MNLRAIILLVLLALIGAFTILNWGSFITPTSLNFLIARIEAPLGVLLLIAMGTLVVVCLLLLAKVEISMMLESRRVTKELENARKLAAEAESSRVESMRKSVLNELAEVHRKLDAILGKSGSG